MAVWSTVNVRKASHGKLQLSDENQLQGSTRRSTALRGARSRSAELL